MESLWRIKTGAISSKKQIGGKYDVIVIGAGMAGILTAYYLKKSGKRVLVLEAKTVASGQTERTTAKITSQHGPKYSTLIQTVGERTARLYAKANEEAIKEYDRLIHERKIECEFERVPSYLYSRQEERVIKDEVEAAKKSGIDAYFTTETELPFEIKGAVCFCNQAQFSPLEFVKEIAAEIEIREYTKVRKIRGNRVMTEYETFTAEQIVVATHYPIRNVPGFYFLRQHQDRSYVVALSGCERIEGMYYEIDGEGLSHRQSGDVLLLGGGSHRTGENKSGGKYDFLMQKAKQYYPSCKEITRWSAQDCMPHDGIPFIGKYSVFTPRLYVATGFQKWGMTSSMVAAMLLSDMLCGKKNPYEEVFSPQRIHFRAGIGNLIKDIGMSTKGLIKGLFGRPRCSHMGCKLEWNSDERSWDCPCHGSRYEADGRLLDNPSTKNASIYK